MTRRRTLGLAALAVAAVVAVIAIGRGGLPWRRPAPIARGDASRGAKLYETLPCGSCHDISHPWPGRDICPHLGNIATQAARIAREPDPPGPPTDAARHSHES